MAWYGAFAKVTSSHNTTPNDHYKEDKQLYDTVHNSLNTIKTSIRAQEKNAALVYDHKPKHHLFDWKFYK